MTNLTETDREIMYRLLEDYLEIIIGAIDLEEDKEEFSYMLLLNQREMIVNMMVKLL